MAIVAYSATRDPASVLDHSSNTLIVLILTFLMFRLRYTSAYRRDIFYFAGLCPFFLLYALVNNNWAYTYYPLGSVALIITGFVLWEFVYLRKENVSRHLPSRQFTLGIVLCLAIFVAKTALTLNFFRFMLADRCSHYVKCHNDDVLAAEVQVPGHLLSFGSISIDFSRWTLLSDYTGASWVTRFPQLWMLPKFLISDEAFTRQHEWILNYVADAFAEDMNHNKPDIMFVEDTDIFYAATVHVDLVAFFSANPHFREAWKHYRFVHNINLCGAPGTYIYIHKVRCSYDVYRRVE